MILKLVDNSRSNQTPEDTLFAYPPFIHKKITYKQHYDP